MVQGSAPSALLSSVENCGKEGDLMGNAVVNPHALQGSDLSFEAFPGAVRAKIQLVDIGGEVSGNKGIGKVQNFARGSQTWANIVAAN
ncbi:hypothetical protein U1Q18_032762, partial [Sarracenia purpurea var. burkii]